MGTERRRLLILGALVAVLAVVLYRTLTETTATAPAVSSSPKGTVSKTARAVPPAAAAPDVHLSVLDDERPRPTSTDRNLFRFKEKAPPPAPPRAVAPPVVSRPTPSAPLGPPPPPPIPLRFIGIVEAPQRSTRLAALVDAAGRPYHGAEGDIVAGQYRILKIGVESIEMAYLDGRGRQTIRLSGS